MKHLKSISLFESVDPKTTDIQADYDRINKDMFGGELKRVPLRWMSTKYKLGVMAYNKQGGIEYVAISNFYSMTRQQYLDVLAHEMIHVWLEQKGIRERDAHGSKFLSKMDELNKRFPEFNIRKSEDAADYNVSAGSTVKEYGVVLFDDNAEYSIVVVDPKVMDDDKALDDFIEGIRKYGLRSFNKLTIKMYKSSNPDLPKFKIKRNLSLKSLELFVLTPDLAEDIMRDKPVREVTLK